MKDSGTIAEIVIPVGLRNHVRRKNSNNNSSENSFKDSSKDIPKNSRIPLRSLIFFGNFALIIPGTLPRIPPEEFQGFFPEISLKILLFLEFHENS